MRKYLPEGFYGNSAEIQNKAFSLSALQEAVESKEVIELRALRCDSEHNLHFKLGNLHGFMPREECALGIADGSVRDIAVISRVNKPTDFYITAVRSDTDGNPLIMLSRAQYQTDCLKNYIQSLQKGDIIPAKVTHIEPFGAFCDIGAGITALLPIDNISVSRIPHPSARLSTGEQIKAVIKDIAADGKITLTLKELLGTWLENAAEFKAGETVTGIIRSVESYGAFVELAPNLTGLAEFDLQAHAGDSASVFIKSINPQLMKIKLIIVDSDASPVPRQKLKYFVDSGHMDFWQYSPFDAVKKVYTDFT